MTAPPSAVEAPLTSITLPLSRFTSRTVPASALKGRSWTPNLRIEARTPEGSPLTVTREQHA
jgi:hypothetical protein